MTTSFLLRNNSSAICRNLNEVMKNSLSFNTSFQFRQTENDNPIKEGSSGATWQFQHLRMHFFLTGFEMKLLLRKTTEKNIQSPGQTRIHGTSLVIFVRNFMAQIQQHLLTTWESAFPNKSIPIIFVLIQFHINIHCPSYAQGQCFNVQF